MYKPLLDNLSLVLSLFLIWFKSIIYKTELNFLQHSYQKGFKLQGCKGSRVAAKNPFFIQRTAQARHCKEAHSEQILFGESLFRSMI